MPNYSRWLLPALAAAALLLPQDGRAQAVRAAPLGSVSQAHCLDTLANRTAADPLRCPAALRTAIIEARDRCRDAGGILTGAKEGEVWALDVDGDARSELMFDLDRHVTCEGAFSLFACGRLICPKTLYELRNGEWTAIGSIAAETPEQVALARTGAAGHRALEVCAKNDCAERWTYEWRGATYEAARIDVRGATVDVAGSIRGLYELAETATLLAQPSARAAEMGRYEAGTDVTVLGTAGRGDYYYVSPCNGCDGGFVPRSAVRIP